MLFYVLVLEADILWIGEFHVIFCKGVIFSVFNFKNHWTGFKQVTIIFCITLTLIGSFFMPILTPPTMAASNPTAIKAESNQKLQLLSDRFDKLEKFVYTQNWNDVGTYIHGPFGEIRRELRMIAGQLSKAQKVKANDLADNLFKNFVKLDIAAKDKDAIAAESAFKNALKDFESIVDLAS